MKPVIAFLLCTSVVSTLVAATANRADAFCIYNNADKPLDVSNWIGQSKGMKVRIAPQKHACCHWSNKDCNPSKKKDSILQMGTVSLVIDEWGLTSGTYMECGTWRKDWKGSINYDANPATNIQGGGYWILEKHPNRGGYWIKSFSHDHFLLGFHMCPAIKPQ